VDIDMNALTSAERNSVPEGYHSIINPEKESPLKVLLYQADILKDCSFLAQHDLEAITLIEVIEHIEMSNLAFLEENIFGVISPKIVIVTTPNYEFNRFFNDVEK
jgi:2-polyprenyl-3-methyl-5-hydroxy-6-metoxy-1,4-benzoquinol methylase